MDLQELLDHRGIEYRKTNNPAEILIACTSGEHIDKSPSLSYNLEKNMFHCWSCNFSGGITKFMKSITPSSFNFCAIVRLSNSDKPVFPLSSCVIVMRIPSKKFEPTASLIAL